MAALILFNLVLIPVVCLFLSRYRKSAHFGIRFCLVWASYALAVHAIATLIFRVVLRETKPYLDMLYSLKYTLIAFVVSLLLALASHFIAQGIFDGSKKGGKR